MDVIGQAIRPKCVRMASHEDMLGLVKGARRGSAANVIGFYKVRYMGTVEMPLNATNDRRLVCAEAAKIWMKKENSCHKEIFARMQVTCGEISFLDSNTKKQLAAVPEQSIASVTLHNIAGENNNNNAPDTMVLMEETATRRVCHFIKFCGKNSDVTVWNAYDVVLGVGFTRQASIISKSSSQPQTHSSPTIPK